MLYEFADVDDAASSLLLRYCCIQFETCAGSAVQCSVEDRERSWTADRPRDLYCRPSRRGRKSARKLPQWRANSLMHHEVGCRSHTDAGIEDVQPVVGFGIKTVHLGSGVHACDDVRPRGQIERSEPGRHARRPHGVDTATNPDESACSDGYFQRLAGHYGEELLGRRDAAVCGEYRFECLTGHATHACRKARPGEVRCCDAVDNSRDVSRSPAEETRKPPKP